MEFVLLNFVSSISFCNLFCQMKQRWSRCKTFHSWITQMKIISIQISIENHFPIAKNLVWKKCSCNFISYLSCFKGQNFRFGNKNAEKKKWLATFETFELWLSLIDEKVLKRSHGIFFSFLIFGEEIAIIKCYISWLSIVWIRIYFYQNSDLISCFELKRT